MTRDELRKHCEKTVETQLRYKNSTNGLEQFHSKRVLSEHQLIIELLDAEAKWLSVIKKITIEIEERATYEGIYLDRADVLDIIDKAVKECEA